MAETSRTSGSRGRVMFLFFFLLGTEFSLSANGQQSLLFDNPTTTELVLR
jgi:hypothetical protein